MSEGDDAAPKLGTPCHVSASRTCSVSACDGKLYKAGYCVEHYVQYEQKEGTAEGAAAAPVADAPAEASPAAAAASAPAASAPAPAPAPAPVAAPVAASSGPAPRFGGGSVPCTTCTKASYPAETLLFETKPYHKNCFRCCNCNKRLDEQQSLACLYESKVYCKSCFQKSGLHIKQTAVKWTQKAPSAVSSQFSGLGGGGNPCQTCGKTVYQGEAVQFESKVYHPKCMKCSTCNKDCNINDCAKYEEKLYCKMCFKKGGFAEKQAQVKFDPNKAKSNPASYRMFNLGGGGEKCANCTKTVYPAELLKFEDRPYHAKCFVCENCKKELKVNAAEHKGPIPYCAKCYNVLGLYQPTLNPAKTAAPK